MKVAFVHYHLKTGGVNTVLKAQVEAVHEHCETLVLTGDRSNIILPCKIVEIPGLGYDLPNAKLSYTDRVAERILAILSEKWPGGCDLLHIHNPTLAKNRQFLQIIKRLQQAGLNLFLQIHDFAEDGRPNTYFEEEYPANCHYGVINTRDADILETAGLKKQGLHILPNPVEGFFVPADCRPNATVIYPVRAIRRKNLGEALLLSCFFDPVLRLAITQPPNSPVDMAAYRDWIKWSKQALLPVDFEVGSTLDFPTLIGGAESVITTSINEGFGLTFLEPWTAGKLLWGRRIPEICTDFENKGVRLDSLYERIDVPLPWIDIDSFTRDWHKAVFDACAHYGHAIDVDEVSHAFAQMTSCGMVDFGLLNEKFQRQVLSRLTTDPSTKKEMIDLNPWLAKPGIVPDPDGLIHNNRLAIKRHYNLQQYRNRLLEIYQDVISQPVHHRIDKRSLVESFIDINHFPLLKWSVYER